MPWMHELDQIRERIARRTDERRTAWLQRERRRYFGWMVTSGVAAILVMAVATLARSIFFGFVAVYLCLFAAKRWMQYRRIARWLSRPMPQNEKERLIWARIFYGELFRPSLWLRLSYWVAAITAVLVLAIVSAVIFATSGVWMRLLWGLADGLVVLSAFIWVFGKLKNMQESQGYRAISRARWSDLT
jgi:ABC-type multidrug transport system permease subunit